MVTPALAVVPTAFWLSWCWENDQPLANHRQLTEVSSKRRLCRLCGKVKLEKSSLIIWYFEPRDMFLRLFGKVTFSKLECTGKPNVKDWRGVGRTTSLRLWLQKIPSVKLWRPSGKTTLSKVWLKCGNVKVLKLLGQNHISGYDWNSKSSAVNNLESLHFPGSGWNVDQKSSFEDLQAKSHSPDSCWKIRRKSIFQDCLTTSPCLVAC